MKSEQLRNADVLLKNIDFNSDALEVNVIIECSNILKYIEAGVTDHWEDDIKIKLNRVIGKFCSSINNENFISIYKNIDSYLQSEFWELFAKYKLYNKIEEALFQDFINEEKPNITYILENKPIVVKYDVLIKKYLISDNENTTILLNHFEIKKQNSKKDLYIPKSLSSFEVDNLVKEYIKSEQSNLNYLNLIINIRNRDQLRISDRTRLLAKRRSEKETDIFFQNSKGYESSITINYAYDQKEVIEYTQQGSAQKITYSLDWIKENLDGNTILNNFIYLFEYVDDQIRITLTSKKSEIATFEELVSVKSINDYQNGFSFKHKEQISNLQLYSYVEILKSFNIDLEDMINWFFQYYLDEHFEINDFSINLPSKNTTYFEKCRTLAPEIESILKKYNLYVEDGFIDSELLEISSKPFPFSSCTSLFEKKWIYPNFEEFDQICHLFFSDQSMLNYLEKENKTYNTFSEILIKRKIFIDDYHEHLHSTINWLVEKDYLVITKNREIQIKDKIKLWIVKDLYINEAISYINFPKIGKSKLDTLLESEYLKSEGTLLSKNEQQFLNFYLNKSEFGNSLDLRNMYLHGSQPQTEPNAEIHKYNYIIFLKIIVLLVIKINDEICVNKYGI